MGEEFIKQIVTIEEFLKNPNKYHHLFEITTQQPLDKEWVEREIFSLGGNLMIGDLNLSQQVTDVIEFHPFPEWVIKIYQPNKNPGIAYAVIPLLTKDEIAQYNKLDFYERNKAAQQKINTLYPKDFIAIPYVDGLCIKIPRNVPHYFLSVIKEGQDVPFLEVFEPKVPILEEVLKNKSNTIMLNLSFKLRLK